MGSVYQLELKIDELCHQLNLNTSTWNPGRGFGHTRYLGVFQGERPRFLKNTLFCVGYDSRGTTHRSEAFKQLKRVISILETLSSDTYFFNAMTEKTIFYTCPENLNLGKSKK